ncbi:hypothetical protein ARALYDRAFT_477093 [Arabidopsis lyrata subsp. lyrata]|uniref:HSF-type DNA-binding domain-containing protein n=1 Tax=Arabidopsis lyrata subsp. lyrata TaxID=81972 RepID=D7KVZ6_ARALL|nr:hypothetical protein ARALYDRAFT_477093 [Arabidopsis lyrata subsp. lyrata]
MVVDDPSLDPIISWSKSNNSFIVWNLEGLHREVLPKSIEFGKHYLKFMTELKFYVSFIYFGIVSHLVFVVVDRALEELRGQSNGNLDMSIFFIYVYICKDYISEFGIVSHLVFVVVDRALEELRGQSNGNLDMSIL